MEYTIIGDPIPLARARHGNGRTWDPQKHLKLHWSLMLSQQHASLPLFEGPIHLEIIFFMAKPKTSQKRRIQLQGQPQFCKPDLDNMIKWVCDCSNNIIFKDDATVASISSKKIYDDVPRTQIRVLEINGKD